MRAVVALSLGLAPLVAGPGALAHAESSPVVSDPLEPQFATRYDLKQAQLTYSDTGFTLRVETFGAPIKSQNVRLQIRLSIGPKPLFVLIDARQFYGILRADANLSSPYDYGDAISAVMRGTRLPCQSGVGFDSPESPEQYVASASWAQVQVSSPVTGTMQWSVETHSDDRDPVRDSISGTSEKIAVAASHPHFAPMELPHVDRAIGTLVGAAGPLDAETAGLQYYPFQNFNSTLSYGVGAVDGGGFACGGAGSPPGRFGYSYVFRQNTPLQPVYYGDELNEAALGEAFVATWPKLVTLDMSASTTVRRGTRVTFRGVVRPFGPYTEVVIEYRLRGPGGPWHTAKVMPLIGGTDQHYSWTWHPITPRDAMTVRTRWTAGATKLAGGNTEGLSNYTRISVT